MCVYKVTYEVHISRSLSFHHMGFGLNSGMTLPAELSNLPDIFPKIWTNPGVGFTVVISTLKKLRKEHHAFKASLGYRVCFRLTKAIESVPLSICF